MSATEVSFLMVALIQAMACVAWASGAWAVPEVRRATAHWAAWSALSAATWLVLALNVDSPPLVGALFGVGGALALQRGIRLYIRRPPLRLLPVLMLAAVVLVDLLADAPATRHLQPVVNFGVLAAIYLGIARDLHGHGRDDLGLRLPWLLALPPLLGAIAFGSRAAKALLSPESVLAEMAAHSALNVGSAIGFIVLVLSLHAMLMALVTARLMTDLRRLSRHDGLTGLLNRRAIEEALDAQMQRSARSGEGFALMMLDVDHFKLINDRHGHAAGDLALKHVATQLRAALRDVDRLGRYGGEEFLIVLPGLALAQAQPVAERLREQLAARPLAQGDEMISLSVSIGVAEWRGGAPGLDRVLAQADAALYRAKAAGRNRVVAGPGPAGGLKLVSGGE